MIGWVEATIKLNHEPALMIEIAYIKWMPFFSLYPHISTHFFFSSYPYFFLGIRISKVLWKKSTFLFFREWDFLRNGMSKVLCMSFFFSSSYQHFSFLKKKMSKWLFETRLYFKLLTSTTMLTYSKYLEQHFIWINLTTYTYSKCLLFTRRNQGHQLWYENNLYFYHSNSTFFLTFK